MGFDVPDKFVESGYLHRQTACCEADSFGNPTIDEPLMRELLVTKYSHWRYEREARCFLQLDEVDIEAGNYFAGFEPNYLLRDVIVGAIFKVTRAQILEAVGEPSEVDIFKTRLAFRSFRVVKNLDQSLWADVAERHD